MEKESSRYIILEPCMEPFADEETECLRVPKRVTQLVSKRGVIRTQLSNPSQVFFTLCQEATGWQGYINNPVLLKSSSYHVTQFNKDYFTLKCKFTG